jgi:hypothetical protein
MSSPTRYAPKSIDDLKALLSDDVKIKVAGVLKRDFSGPKLIQIYKQASMVYTRFIPSISTDLSCGLCIVDGVLRGKFMVRMDFY